MTGNLTNTILSLFDSLARTGPLSTGPRERLTNSLIVLLGFLGGCIAGAVLVDETERMLRSAGLSSIVLKKKPEYVRALQSFEDPLYSKIAEHLPAGTTVADFLTSLDVEARKAAGALSAR